MAGTRQKSNKTGDKRTVVLSTKVYNRLHQLVDPIAEDYRYLSAPRRISISDAIELFLKEKGLW